MIVLDTNIASVIATPDHPDLPMVLAWQQASRDQDFRITAITRAEMAYGVAILPAGARKTQLTEAVARFWDATAEHTLAFGQAEADAYGVIMAARRLSGRPMGVLDAQIAATAFIAGAAVATRNVGDFVDCGVPVVNPYGAVS